MNYEFVCIFVLELVKFVCDFLISIWAKSSNFCFNFFWSNEGFCPVAGLTKNVYSINLSQLEQFLNLFFWSSLGVNHSPIKLNCSHSGHIEKRSYRKSI